MEYKLQPYGHNAWLIRFTSNGFSKALCLNILKLAALFRTHTDINQKNIWQDVVPAYDSLLLKTAHYISRQKSQARITQALDSFIPTDNVAIPKSFIEIPVSYGGEFGPDLRYVADMCGLSPEDIIQRHSERPYLVCLMGFIPGFAFMSETDPTLHIARRKTPRPNVPKGSVGLAGWQTGIYGLESPGGWQIIGRTPLTLFDPHRNTPFLLKAGDWIKFIPQDQSLYP